MRHIRHIEREFTGQQTQAFTFVDAVLLPQEVRSLTFVPERTPGKKKSAFEHESCISF